MRKSRFRLESEAEAGRFDFAPMVDVVLVLVIFFMLSSNLIGLERRLGVQLPQAQSASQAVSPVVTVTLSKSGQISVDGSLVGLNDLEETLKPKLEQSGGKVLLRADRAAPYGSVVRVMDTVKQAGGTQLALATVSQ